jgi:beta-glucanase (GH16 family)
MKIDQLLYPGRSKMSLIILISLSRLFLLSCDKEQPSVFTPDFTYTLSAENPNIVRFVNTTSGDHSFIQWDFGNGENTVKQPANRLTYSVEYSQKGDYPVTLQVWGNSGKDADLKPVTKIVTIEHSILHADFEYEITPESPNLLKIRDVSSGEYDSITWRYPGRVTGGSPGEEKVIYLAMAGKYDIELEIARGDVNNAITKQITILNDDPNYLDRYQLVWSDDFVGDELNSTRWVHETGGHGWGNNELQYYTDGLNTTVEGGNLKITALKPETGQHAGTYTSSRINSKNSFTYGRIEVRARMTEYKGAGLWPAIWMLGTSIREGTSWPLCGEIDIMEYVSWKPDHFSSAIHTESNNHTIGNTISTGHISLPSVEEEFNIYGIIWTYTSLQFYLGTVDNIIMTYRKPVNHNQNNWPFDKPFFLLLNIAVGGSYGGVDGVSDLAFPAVMEIDYVHVYQH